MCNHFIFIVKKQCLIWKKRMEIWINIILWILLIFLITKVRSVEKENICSPDSKERLHQAHQAVESDDRVQTNGSWKRSSLAEDYLPRFQVTFRCSLLQDQLFFFTFAGSLISTRTDSSTRESFVGWPLLQWSVHKSYKPSFRFWILCSGSDVSRVF